MAYEIKQRPGQDDEEQPAQMQPGGAYSGMSRFDAPVATPMVGASTPAPSAQPEQGVPGSKFVNFDRILSANQDVAKREANALADKYDKPANAALTGVSNYRTQFANDVRAGQPNWPFSATTGGSISSAGDPNNYGDPGLMDFNRKATETQAGKNTGWHNVGENAPAGQSISSPAAGRSMPASLKNLTGIGVAQTGPTQTAGQQGRTISKDQAQQLAGAQYTGPMSLGDESGWNTFAPKAAQDAALAAGLANPNNLAAAIDANTGEAVGTGANRMDAGLLGAAGQGRFSQMAQKYGNLGKIIDDANGQSVQAGAGAKARTQQTADYWGGQLQQRAGQEKEQADWLNDQKTGFDKQYGFDDNPDVSSAVKAEIGRQYGDKFYFMTDAQKQAAVESAVRAHFPDQADQILSHMRNHSNTRAGLATATESVR